MTRSFLKVPKGGSKEILFSLELFSFIPAKKEHPSEKGGNINENY